MKSPVFTGSSVAIVTPFRDGEIYYEKFRQLLELQIVSGTSAITVCGTTGESATLSEKEHIALVDFCVQNVGGRAKVIAGSGSNNTETALRFARQAEHAGADAILAVTPYYNKTTQAGLIRYYFDLADSISIPVIAYNVPSRTGMTILPETYKALAEHPNMNGVKEASGNISVITEVLAECGSNFHVWSGNDSDIVPLMALGAKGVISTAANIIPEAISAICELCLVGDFEIARSIQLAYSGLIRTLFLEVNPIPVKTAMNLIGLDVGELRSPLCPMRLNTEAELRKELENVGLLSHSDTFAE